MVKLTERKVLASSRASSLKNVKNLNCWASDIDDASILKQMPNLEVLNLSVNNISSLKDMKLCPKLKELYLRKNSITDISDLVYLKHLPQLRVLWLSENPCTDMKNYRSTVLRNLPNLKKLDNKEIDESERRLAEIEGEELDISPADLLDFSGLDLSVTLHEDDLAKFMKTSHVLMKEYQEDVAVMEKIKEKIEDEREDKLAKEQRLRAQVPKQSVDLDDINAKRTQLGLKPLDIDYANQSMTVKSQTQDAATGKSNSNVLKATLLLLEDLGAEELRTVISQAEEHLNCLESVDERDAILD